MRILDDFPQGLGDLVDVYDAVRAGLKDAPEFIPVYYARFIGLIFIYRLRWSDHFRTYEFATKGFSEIPALCLLRHIGFYASREEPTTDDRNCNERWQLLHLFNHVKMEDWIKLQTNPNAEMTTTNTLPWLWIDYHIYSEAFYSLARYLSWPLRIPSSKEPKVPDPVRTYAMYTKQDVWSLVTAIRLVFGDNGRTWRPERLALKIVGYSHDFERLWDVDDYQAYTALMRKQGKEPWTESDFLLTHTLEYDMAHKAVDAGFISARRDGQTGMFKVEPGSYLDWVKSKGFVVPKELDAVRTVPAHLKTKMKVHGRTVNANKEHVAIVEGVRRLLADTGKKYLKGSGTANCALIAIHLLTREELRRRYLPTDPYLPVEDRLTRIISKGLKDSIE